MAAFCEICKGKARQPLDEPDPPTQLPEEPAPAEQVDTISDKLDYLHLKPNFFGLGIDVNKIIRDTVAHFRRKRQ